MKTAQIKVGGHYSARVSGNFVTVRVDAIRERFDYKGKSRTVFDVTNLRTGRKLTFASAQKFRHEVKPPATLSAQVESDKDYPLISQINNKTLVVPDADTIMLPPRFVETMVQQRPLFDDQVKSEPASPGSTNSEGEKSSDPTSTAGESNSADGGSVSNNGIGLAGKIAASVTAQRDNAVRRLTDEQQAIVAAAPGTQVLVVEAGAGCGKTSTLVELAKAMPGIGQYTAFNASLVAESKTKFPRHVNCNTVHSLGFRAEGCKHAHRLGGRRVTSSEVAAILGLSDLTISGADGQPKVLNAALLASQVTRSLKSFCQSADTEVALHHLPRLPGVDAENSRVNSDMVKAHLLPFAQKMWADKCSPKGTMPFTHDDYVKMWEMNNPVIAGDYVLLDEAQDVSPVMLSIMAQQVKRGTRVILVGDSAQQIYSWRGAVNALAAFPDAPRLMLSQSFRFGPVIAAVANAVLSHLGETTPLVMRGFDAINSRLGDVDAPAAILCRTNAGALSHLIEAIAQKKRPHLIGGGDDVSAFVRAARDLQIGKSTNHPELCCFANWNEVRAYAKTDDGDDLKLMVKLIDQFTPTKLLNALASMPAEKDAELVISTAHKSKGREWKTCKLASDFMPLDKMGDEEVRLLYVAATRAQNVLDVESCPPFCGGTRREDEGGTTRTIDLGKARQLSKELPAPEPVAQQASPEPTTATTATTAVAAVEVKQETANGSPNNTWAKDRNGEWAVRGAPGQSGSVDVYRRDGSKKQATIKRVIWQDAKTALYEVVV